MTQTIFERLGVRPVINASGIYTDLGGSRLSPSIWAAMAEANDSFIDLVELLDRTGQTIAGMLGVEAARITPGASAAIALGIGACLTGDDREKMERLPETSGMPNEVIMQRGHRYKYDRCALLPGARIVEVGSEAGTRREESSRLSARTPSRSSSRPPRWPQWHRPAEGRSGHRAGTWHPHLCRRRVHELPR